VELAELIGIRPITLTRQLDQLAKMDLIERRQNPRDRRGWHVYLKPAAQPLLQTMHEIGTELVQEGLQGLDGQQVEGLLAGLEIMQGNLSRGRRI
jgi:DNA-binding MarR family transcriptional regulator